MYASPFATPSHAGQARSQLYRDVGVRTGVGEASPHQLVTMLYDGLVEAIMQGRGAIAARQIEAKSRALTRALRIVDEGLKAPINVAEGGELALRLSDLYDYISLRLTEANVHNDDAALGECLSLIEPLREGWQGIAAQVRAPATR